MTLDEFKTEVARAVVEHWPVERINALVEKFAKAKPFVAPFVDPKQEKAKFGK